MEDARARQNSDAAADSTVREDETRLFSLDATSSLFFPDQTSPHVIARRNEVETVESQAVGEPKPQPCTEDYPNPTPPIQKRVMLRFIEGRSVPVLNSSLNDTTIKDACVMYEPGYSNNRVCAVNSYE